VRAFVVWYAHVCVGVCMMHVYSVGMYLLLTMCVYLCVLPLFVLGYCIRRDAPIP